MNGSIFLLRLSYWSAAIADFAIVFLAWIPERMGVPETVYPMALTSAIAFSWAVLLLVADRRPLERRWILPPTILVVALIAVTRTTFSLDGTLVFSFPLLTFAVGLIVLMAFSYYRANRYASGLRRQAERA